MISAHSFQLLAFAVSIAAGFLLGAVYDVLRIWRDFFHSERRAVFFQDFFYMIFCAFFSFLLALALNKGAVRIYQLIGEAAGWFVYYYTVGQVTACVFRFFSGLLYRFFFNPIGGLFRRISVRLTKKERLLIKTLKKKALRWKKRLKHHGGIVYNLRSELGRRRRKRKVVRKNERT